MEKKMLCRCCQKEIFLHPFLTAGHPYPTEEEKKKQGIVYSEAGYREIHISGVCEACFDRLMNEPEDEEEDDNPCEDCDLSFDPDNW